MRNKPQEFIKNQKENAAELRADKATSSPARRPPQHDAVWQTADNERTSPVELDTVTVVPEAQKSVVASQVRLHVGVDGGHVR